MHFGATTTSERIICLVSVFSSFARFVTSVLLLFSQEILPPKLISHLSLIHKVSSSHAAQSGAQAAGGQLAKTRLLRTAGGGRGQGVVGGQGVGGVRGWVAVHGRSQVGERWKFVKFSEHDGSR